MGSKLDLVLVAPGDRYQIYQKLGAQLSAVDSPVWAGLMATFVRRKGYSVRIIDANAEALSPVDVAERIDVMNPRLVAVVCYGHQPSASTQVMPSASAITTAIKQQTPRLPVILVGGHAAALPERTLHEEAADFVADGEGLYTLLDLLESLQENIVDCPKVRSLWYRADGHETLSAMPAPLLQNLDEEMPGIAWDLLPMHLYRAHNWHTMGTTIPREGYASIYTTLGCPYKCEFCCIQAPFKAGQRAVGIRESVHSYRFWSPQTIVDQMEVLARDYNVHSMRIADEMFVLNAKHVNGICDLLIERGVGINLWSYARIDTVRGDITPERLKAAGMNWLCFGIESGSERVRASVAKRFDQSLVYETIGKVRAAGINVIGNYIFGLPEDDLASMQETLDLSIELCTEFWNGYTAMAYPGSPLYTMAEREGWALPERWSGYSQHSVDTTCLPTKYLSAAEVLEFRDAAFRTYFEHPKYRMMMRQRFGAESLAEVDGMLLHRLDRALLKEAA